MEQSATFLSVVVWCNIFSECVVHSSRWIGIHVALVVSSRLMVVVDDITIISWSINLMIEIMDFVALAKIVSPLVVVKMLKRARLHVVTLEMHKHGGGLCLMMVPRINSCYQVASSV